MAKNTETQTLAGDTPVTITGDQLLALVQDLVRQNQATTEALAKAIPTAMGDALAEANQRARQWWKEEEFPGISVFNPKGDLHHPKPVLNRDVLWLGFPLQEEQQTAGEIRLLNRLRPGDFDMHDDMGGVIKPAFFKVRSLDPGSPNGRLLVTFPCATTDERMLLQRYDRGRGQIDILLELVPEAKTEPEYAPGVAVA